MRTSGDPYQNGLAKLRQLAQSVPGDRNEDTTRFQLIDVLLIDCLGHFRPSITTEEHMNPGYADYIVSLPGRTLVLEAKREGKTFELPAGLEGRATVAMKTLCEDKAAKEAVDQVLGYAQKMGIPLAGIANGHQLAVFLGSRVDGKSPFEGDALVFASFGDMVNRFRSLWDMLSREALVQRRLIQVLMAGSPSEQPPPKLSSTILSYPGFRRRSPRETDLKILSSIFIQDIEGDAQVSDDFLRECYYESGTLSQYALVSKEILRNRYSALPDALGVEAEGVRSKKGISPTLKHDLVAGAVSSKPIVLLGDVGVGKTMFIKHLLRVEAATELTSSLVFYVDFGRQPALQTDLQEHIVDSIVDQLRDEHEVDLLENSFVRAVYNRELNRFRRGIYGPLATSDPPGYASRELEMLSELIANTSKHLERSLKHLDGTARKKSVIVLDNIDQRPTEFQNEIFVIAQSLAASLGSTVFVSLRPTTFFESKRRGTLAAYQPRAFLVSPPRVSEVISKRLSFARKTLLDKDVQLSGLSLNREDLLVYLDALELGFTRDKALIELLENLSGGNVRLALEFLSSFIGSGYVDTGRVLDVASAGETYVIPIHEFLRSILFGDNDYYDPSSSRIVNVFDIVIGDEREHFLLPLLLGYVHAASTTQSKEGFVDIGEVFDVAQQWDYKPEQIQWHLNRAVLHRLLETVPGNEQSGPYRITNVGAYMHKEMVTQFSYLDAMTVDTPILDPTIRSEVQDVRSIDDRLRRAEVFKSYLDGVWESFASPESFAFDWNVQGARLVANIGTARAKAERAKARRDEVGGHESA
ncbi:hypothetical protein DM793_07860 [Paenarthrobacter nitroguajacolicus]|uniref:hypothetical protein n=1 Tax=Paenarthrobacter nitroguajacolicus TaxID=211146 RepID=UPI0015B95FA4|nr:hypothetical protein [Paenarthrobacter nitroguajacolicus]NWL11210.1 hypothetical protein [Paenarthrobacter nitroguajacolicus]